MNKEEIVIKNLIVNYLINKNFDLVKKILINLKSQGKLVKVKKKFNSIIEELYERNNILIGELELVFKENENFIKEKILKNYNFFIRKIKINNDLILGGIFRTKKIELNFNLVNIIRKIFS